MKYYASEVSTLLDALQTNLSTGLSNDEINKRLEENGLNEIPKVSKGFFKIYLAPLFNWLIVIYLLGSLILLIASLAGAEGSLTMIYLTLGIVGLNCLVAIFQQARATKKLNALRELSAPTTTVLRDGEKKEIQTKYIVRGDILILDQGSRIPADARIIESSNLEVNEASLTGESEPVKKNHGQSLENKELPLSEQKNILFYGTFITMGNAKAVVVEIGSSTEIGKISVGLEDAGTSEIPIRKKMNNFGKWLGILVMGFWLIVMFILWIATGEVDIVKSLNSAMDIMPINIPLLTTIVLLTGVLAMAQQGVIVRNLASVDSLGRVSVVCTDKTGTLTKSQMCVQHIWVNGRTFYVSGTGYNPKGAIFLESSFVETSKLESISTYPELEKLILSGFLNNNASIVKKNIKHNSTITETWNVLGTPTEGALVTLFQKSHHALSKTEFKSLHEYPFDSSIKRMSKIFNQNGNSIGFTKGATEILLPLCNSIYYNDQIVKLDSKICKTIVDATRSFANQGYRILSLCYKDIEKNSPPFEENRTYYESDLIYLGFVTILDPPREGVKEAVEQCHTAGVDVVMITGDSPITAQAIASQISIIDSDDAFAIEGHQIEDYLEKEEFNKIRVFARVSPEHKQDIVKKYQSKRKVVAMTGDGVNDALALNLADAGIAMGIQGTDVAKEASDMVISDDSFNSIVGGIRQGRGIFAKIRNVVFFYICINLFEGIVQFILAVVLNKPYFLDDAFSYQWVFLSITLHTLPGLILTFDTISEDVMKEKPRDSEEILSKPTLILLISFGILLSICMLLVYFICITGNYPLFHGNWQFGQHDPSYLYSVTYDLNFYFPEVESMALFEQMCSYLGMDPTLDTLRVIGKTLTMLMTTLFFCESLLVFQIRRPNKSLWRSIKEDSNKGMFGVIGLLFFAFLGLMYTPAQIYLANWGINFMFMPLTMLDWAVCFAISLICILGFEGIKFIARKNNFVF